MALWRSAVEAGMLVPLNQTIEVGPDSVEVVGTYADSAMTAIMYKRSGPDDLDDYDDFEISARWPPEAIGMARRDSDLDDISVALLSPVLAHRRHVELLVGPDEGGPDHSLPSVTVPVDRSLTAATDRVFQLPPPAQQGGVRVTVLGAGAGAIASQVDVEVEPVDDTILGIDIGDSSGPLLHIHDGPGPRRLWREWFPEAQEAASASEHVVVKAEKTTASFVAIPVPASKISTPRPMPPRSGWSARVNPRNREVHVSGNGHSGPAGVRSWIHNLWFEPPDLDAKSVTIEIDPLRAFQFANPETCRLPAPQREQRVTLEGMLESPHGSFELLAWEPRPDTYSLTLRPSTPELHPDIRILGAETSANLWTQFLDDGTIFCSLPRSYDPLFETEGTVEVALRMVGVPVGPFHLDLRLEPLPHRPL